MNVALIPCFNRPEFLVHCLENIRNADGAENVHYIFRLDTGFDRGNLEVIGCFPFSHSISYTTRTSYKLAKQSYSLLTGLIEAARQSTDLVYLIEDDVIIGRDFFRWHDQVHKHHTDLFSSHANLNVNRHIQQSGTWDQYYLTTEDYGSIGTCMNRNTILNDIAPHAQPLYYRSPIFYVQRTFPASTLNKDQAEQDGLIRRIQTQSNRPQAYPHTYTIDGLLYGPRCFHAGFYGKNRAKRKAGDWRQKVASLRHIIYSEEVMRTFVLEHNPGSLGFYLDSRPCALELPAWQTLKLKALGAPEPSFAT